MAKSVNAAGNAYTMLLGLKAFPQGYSVHPITFLRNEKRFIGVAFSTEPEVSVDIWPDEGRDLDV